MLVESLMATARGPARRSRCHRTCCGVVRLVAPLGTPAVGGSACAGRSDVVVVAVAVVGNDVAGVAERALGAQAFGGDSSSARGRLGCHNRRRTSIRCLQGRQKEEKSNSWVMQVAEAETSGASMRGANVLCEVNEWISECRAAGRANQCMRLRAVVLS